MGHDVGGEEAGEPGVLALAALDAVADRLLRLELGRGEEGDDPGDVLGRQVERLRVAGGEFGLDLAAQRLERLLVHQDLDARLELVVAPSLEIVDAQDRLDIAEEVALGQEFADLAADERRAPHAAADIDGKAELILLVAHDLKTDVMRLDHRAVMASAIDRDLELARQEREFRMKRRPLPEDFGVRTRIGDLVVGDAGVMVRGDVADAVARGLDRVHLDARELGEDVRRVLQRRPIELDVLPGGEMPVAAVVLARDLGELAHLTRAQRAVGHGDAQHVGMELEIEAIHQPVRAKLLFGEFAGEAPGDLVAELLDPRGDEGRVEIIIMIHGRPPSQPSGRRAARGPRPACRDRA